MLDFLANQGTLAANAYAGGGVVARANDTADALTLHGAQGPGLGLSVWRCIRFWEFRKIGGPLR